ncbi:hypothetical protein ACGFI9_13880 [Micromonospora sp. NPDC048930]|uniref:hypothetical protein n=1 Tax=Micromonospora sp. NPDC048930 TaxID=3364261 RepID=UPI003722BF4D
MAIDLVGLLCEATDDLTRLYPKPPDPFTMYGRFLGWVRRLPANPSKDGRFHKQE